MRGVGEVIWRVEGNRRPCCGQGIGFCPSSSRPSVARIRREGPPIVLWGSGDFVGR